MWTHSDTTVGTVVERPLEPLDTRGHERVLVNDHQVPREGANALAAHRVPLVRHRTASDLVLLERLLDLLEVCEETDVGRDLVRGRTEGREGREDVDVDFAGVGLSRDGVRGGEAVELGDKGVQLFDLNSKGGVWLRKKREARAGRIRRPTLSWSPLKRARNEAWVPVVPLTPRNPMSLRARSMFLRSQRSSCEDGTRRPSAPLSLPPSLLSTTTLPLTNAPGSKA